MNGRLELDDPPNHRWGSPTEKGKPRHATNLSLLVDRVVRKASIQ